MNKEVCCMSQCRADVQHMFGNEEHHWMLVVVHEIFPYLDAKELRRFS